jgi:hypothetical protein
MSLPQQLLMAAVVGAAAASAIEPSPRRGRLLLFAALLGVALLFALLELWALCLAQLAPAACVLLARPSEARDDVFTLPRFLAACAVGTGVFWLMAGRMARLPVWPRDLGREYSWQESLARLQLALTGPHALAVLVAAAAAVLLAAALRTGRRLARQGRATR